VSMIVIMVVFFAVLHYMNRRLLKHEVGPEPE
jgi:hypothetical protein